MKKFTKMHGLGNDYVYMDAIHQKIDNGSELARFVSNRHFGIGSDGLILICKSDIADFKMRMFNQDGSEAEMCGNGIRCVGKFVYDKGLTNKTTVTIETLAGIKTLKFNLKDKKVETVRVDMGEPILNPEKIPVISSENPVKNLKLKALDKEFIFTCVSMGNPHAVVYVDDVDNLPIEEIGPKFESHERFPRRVNTEFVKVLDRHTVQMRVWERGSAETLACGTGATASALATAIHTHSSCRNFRVDVEGGTLWVSFESPDLKNFDHIFLTGSARKVFSGETAEIF